ncbi:MAG: 3-hydroxyacyl-CoA dehydrogenase [Candidatus Contendobacter odensis]|uniref:3-hydroxyacyl-CoA dehydrogenase n=1 Tax=Candidatus Contendibacter odensensis TaxID=1400860 RepID=A0A2G6PEA7_9GAMM|nr:MAG: 3-hydroxyacyl-CoA dehydrogenase [Candidatus Contendobacter odensis]
MNIDNHVFLVTGGASGLGAATASTLIATGGKVAIADINRDAGEALASELGSNACFIPVDIGDETRGAAAISTLLNTFGTLHGLINCAGIAPAEKLLSKAEPFTLSTFTKVIQINLVGAFNMIRHAATAMAKNELTETNERGVIINTASIAAFEGQVGQTAYAASKGGVVAMTLPLARELSRNAIRVMTIAPGVMRTPMVTGMSQDIQDSLGKMIPFPSRPGKPDEFADLACHIIENTYLNGEVIRLDGAIRMGSK